MTDHRREETRAFTVSVTFRSGPEAYAAETYLLDAAGAFHAARLARDRARDRVYHDARIPDLDLVVDITPFEPEPDPPSPAVTSAGRPRPVS
jgi:hypothetical protein